MLLDMTTALAAAHRRAIRAPRDVGPAKLLPRQEACVREGADAIGLPTHV
jgi:hypothetical protein